MRSKNIYKTVKEFLNLDANFLETDKTKGGGYHIYLLHDMIKILTFAVIGIGSFLSGTLLMIVILRWLA